MEMATIEFFRRTFPVGLTVPSLYKYPIAKAKIKRKRGHGTVHTRETNYRKLLELGAFVA